MQQIVKFNGRKNKIFNFFLIWFFDLIDIKSKIVFFTGMERTSSKK